MTYTLRPVEGMNTNHIQKYIDTCFINGGGKIVLEAGTYLIGGLRLRTNCHLYLKKGAVLKGSRNPEDYKILKNDTLEPVDEEYFTDAVWVSAKRRLNHDHITKAASNWNNAMIRIFKAENVSVTGEEGSVIDGSDCYDEIGEEHYRGPHGISFHYCKELKFGGYTIRNTGNWAHLGFMSQNMHFENVICLGGHDGIHVSSCDDIDISNCEFYTGDDCVAGFDNYNVHVNNCIINSACSGFRFGGADILIENCKVFAPAKYFFRGSLSLEDKIEGNPAPKTGRKNMLCLYTYYSDFSLKVRRDSENILIRNCEVENVDRFLHYDFTGKQIWQKNRPLKSIAFEGIKAKGVAMPLNAYGDSLTPLTLSIKDSQIEFSDSADCAIKGGYFKLIEAKNLKIENLNGAFVKVYGGEGGKIETENLEGVELLSQVTDEQFDVKAI